MSTPADTAAIADVPAVLRISSGIWLVLGSLGTLWTLTGLLMVLAFSGMVAPQTYLPALTLYLASGVVFVSAVVLSILLGRGRRAARLVLSAYVVILPVLLYFRGGPFPGGMPWREALLSPAGAVGGLAVVATVLMWLPPASTYIARSAAHTRATRSGSEPPSDRVPSVVTAAMWTLVVSGGIAALEAVLGLLLLSESIGSDAKTTPALVLYLTLASAAVAYFTCARAVRRGKPFVRPVITVIPLVGLIVVVLATVAAFSNVPAGSPTAAAGLPAAIFLTVFSQGLPLVGGLVAAALVRLPSARRYFRRVAEVLPA